MTASVGPALHSPSSFFILHLRLSCLEKFPWELSSQNVDSPSDMKEGMLALCAEALLTAQPIAGVICQAEPPWTSNQVGIQKATVPAGIQMSLQEGHQRKNAQLSPENYSTYRNNKYGLVGDVLTQLVDFSPDMYRVLDLIPSVAYTRQTSVIPALGRQRKYDQKFRVTLSYIASLRICN